jgi:hypothetical protein
MILKQLVRVPARRDSWLLVLVAAGYGPHLRTAAASQTLPDLVRS